MIQKDEIIEPIDGSFEDVASDLIKSIDTPKKLPSALYRGTLPIGGVELDCAVLDNGTRVLSASSIFATFDRPRRGANSRLEINGISMPAFMDASNLKPFIDQDVISQAKPMEYLDGKQKKTGYVASLLPKMCEVYLAARRDEKLTPSQKKLAEKSEILLSAFAQVGVDALIDEATGYQYDRKHDALRLLLSKYLAEGLQKWIKTFPDPFFVELDRLYGNELTTSRKRSQYYGNFINRYIYKPMENGYLKEELDKLNITDKGKRKARFHQWLSSDGRSILTHQIGRIQGKMEECKDIEEFKKKATHNKKMKTSIAPILLDKICKSD